MRAVTTNWPLRKRWIIAVLISAVAVAGCSSPSADEAAPTVASSSSGAGSSTQAPTTSAAQSEAPDQPFAGAAIEAPPLPPGQPLPDGEVEGSCPYIKAGLNIEPDPDGISFADFEGNRVQRVTQLTTLQPIGCRFYFQSDYHATGDILPSTYSSPVAAYNAMVLTAQAGTSIQARLAFDGTNDGASFRTTFSSPDDGQDWAFAFAKGSVMVVVRTDRTDGSEYAVSVARAIIDKF